MTTSKPTTTVPSWSDRARQLRFKDWLASLSHLGVNPSSVQIASADASFRRYFRIESSHGSRIIMDAPPVHEDCKPFVKIANLLRNGGLNCPEVLAWDEDAGFMLLSDLGHDTYLSKLNEATVSTLYEDACSALVRMQNIKAQKCVPAYDEPLLRRELNLFPEWYIERHAGLKLKETTSRKLEGVFDAIVANNLAQPRALVHRDYHSRNLMVTEQGNPGILDFQDAVWGPLTYDLASLLRDAYIEWNEETQFAWVARYWKMALRAGLPVTKNFELFWRDFEWMSLQRHLKVLGIFCRLNYRDGKSGYLKDMPLVWRYAHRTALRYRELDPLVNILESVASQAASHEAA